ncbi:MAG: biotin/lipoyl-binding protein, partial [Janthinobacterium lividum]
MADVEQDMGKKGDDAPKDKAQGEPQGKEQPGKEQSGKDQSGKEPQAGKEEDKPGKRKPLWPWLLGGTVILAFVAVVLAVIFAPAPNVWTDDAYITAHYASVAPRISGQIASVEVDDNQPVTAQQLLVTIDDRDFRAALASAEAMLERDMAQLAESSASITRQPSVVEQSQTQNPSAVAQLAFAQANQRRYRNLSATGAGTVQERQQADQQVQQAQSAVDQARASTDAAKRQIPILEAQRAAAAALVKADKARVEQAQL